MQRAASLGPARQPWRSGNCHRLPCLKGDFDFDYLYNCNDSRLFFLLGCFIHNWSDDSSGRWALCWNSTQYCELIPTTMGSLSLPWSGNSLLWNRILRNVQFILAILPPNIEAGRLITTDVKMYSIWRQWSESKSCYQIALFWILTRQVSKMMKTSLIKTSILKTSRWKACMFSQDENLYFIEMFFFTGMHFHCWKRLVESLAPP